MADRPEFQTRLISEFMKENSIEPMDLVRLCEVGVSTAYKLQKATPMTDLNVLYKVYTGLKESGYDVTWEKLTGIT